MAPYVGRLAPSPTGDLHLGHVRTFAVAWLRARQAGGTIGLRIEDLDPPREVPGSAQRIVEDLAWLGFDWDGPITYQSSHHARYEAALEKLQGANRVFRCSCSRKDVAQVASAPHGAEELGPRYPGTCHDGPRGTAPFAIRFRSDEQRVVFEDTIAGSIDGSAWLDDFVLRRKDDLWAYQFAVVVDDAHAGVSEVVRGDDLLSSTPRQLALYRALGCEPPQFSHVPLVLDASGERLSKRSHKRTIRDLQRQGATAQEVIARIAPTLGMSAEAQSLGHMLDKFTLERVPRQPIRL